MANNYVQGTITPDIPLTDIQREALGIGLEDIPVSPEERSEAQALRSRWSDDYMADDWTSGLTIVPAGDGVFYLYSEEGGLETGFDAVLQEILQGLPEAKYPFITYEAAYYCSKMRQGEFGGVACIITRDDIQWMATSGWLQDAKDALKGGGA